MIDKKSAESEVGLKDILLSLSRVEHKLEQLQVNTGGEKWHEPGAADVGKVTCKVRCSVITVGHIDTIKQEFWAEVYLTLQWRENQVRGQCAKDIDWNEYWDPQIYFVNAIKIDHREQWHKVIDNDDGSADVRLSIRMRATFCTAMKLGCFPFDYQELTIKLMSDWPINPHASYVEFRNAGKDNIRTDTFTDGHEWTLHKHLIAEPVNERKEETGAKNEFSHYHISMHVQRHYAYYMLNIVLVVFLILALSFASFSVPAENAEGRFSVTVALLLTAVAYKYVVTSKLPMISYLTLLERYVLFCLIIHSLMVIQNALALALVVDIVDYISIAVLAGLALAVHVNLIVAGILKTKGATAKMKEFRKKYEETNEQMSNNGGQSVNGNHVSMGGSNGIV